MLPFDLVLWYPDRQPPSHEMSQEDAGDEEGDVQPGKASPHPHQDDKRDHQVDGQPPSEGVPVAPDPPRTEGEGDEEGCGQQARQEDRVGG